MTLHPKINYWHVEVKKSGPAPMIYSGHPSDMRRMYGLMLTEQEVHWANWVFNEIVLEKHKNYNLFGWAIQEMTQDVGRLLDRLIYESNL